MPAVVSSPGDLEMAQAQIPPSESLGSIKNSEVSRLAVPSGNIEDVDGVAHHDDGPGTATIPPRERDIRFGHLPSPRKVERDDGESISRGSLLM
jgi:hypothetical protein